MEAMRVRSFVYSSEAKGLQHWAACLALDGELQRAPQEHGNRWQVELAGGEPRRRAVAVAAAAVGFAPVPARITVERLPGCPPCDQGQGPSP